MRFHQCVTQLLQESPPSTPAVPVLVHFPPYYKGIVGPHINHVEEDGRTKGQRPVVHQQLYVAVTLSMLSGYQGFCPLWCSGQHLSAQCSSAGHGSLSWCNRRRQWLRGTLRLVHSHCPQHSNLPFQQFFTQDVRS